MIKNIIYIIFTICVLQGSVFAKPKILVTIMPVASIVAGVTGDSAEVEVLDSSAGCPHEHNHKPSQIKKLQDADAIIYIDESFESFIAKPLDSYNGKVLHLGKLQGIMQSSEGQANWHIWLDLNNVLTIQKGIARFLSQNFPDIAQTIDTNLQKSITKLQELEKIKRDSLKLTSGAIILTDSAEYFFTDMDEVTRSRVIYRDPKARSLKQHQNIHKLLQEDKGRCVVISYEQEKEKYATYTDKLIQIDAENWLLPEGGRLEDLFYDKYLEIIKKISICN